MSTVFHPADRDALPQVKALYDRLRAREGRQVMFGQQDTFVVGTTFEANKPENLGKSDILKSTGFYPGVAGFDVGHLEVYYTAERDPEFAELIKGKDRTGGDFEPGMNIDNISFDFMREAIRLAHEKGSVVTVSWHSVNPLTGGEYGKPNRSWEESVVKAVLPGGKLNARFNLYLDAFIEFNSTLLDGEGNQIPYIFRPFHEHSGDWFWWCIDSTENPNDGTAWSGDHGRLNDPEDFAALYRYAVDYLQAHGVHNLLYCICPDRSRLDYEGTAPGFNETLAAQWMVGYPGDAYIDLFGLDDYWDFGHGANTAGGEPVHGSVQFDQLKGSIETLCTLAQHHGKLAALTEMGVANTRVLEELGEEPLAPYTRWLLQAVNANETTRKLLYGLVWRKGFISEDADPNAVFRFKPNDPEDFSKGFERIYLHSLKEDFNRFAQSENTYFVEP